MSFKKSVDLISPLPPIMANLSVDAEGQIRYEAEEKKFYRIDVK